MTYCRSNKIDFSPMVTGCAIESCDGKVKARGWCGAHYQRWRRFGDPEFFPPEVNKRCSIEGCSGVTNARGFCGSHYYRWKRYGDPLKQKNKSRAPYGPRNFQPRACVTCGAMFDPGNSIVRKYCSPPCRPSRSSMGVNKRSTVERLGVESGWVCHLCGDAVDPSLYWPNRYAGSVDHVIPVSLGGTDDWSNLKMAHLTCNTARGATPITSLQAHFEINVPPNSAAFNQAASRV